MRKTCLVCGRFQRGHFSMCPAGKKSQHHAFVEIVARFIVDGSPEEINIRCEPKSVVVPWLRRDCSCLAMSVIGWDY